MPAIAAVIAATAGMTTILIHVGARRDKGLYRVVVKAILRVVPEKQTTAKKEEGGGRCWGQRNQQ